MNLRVDRDATGYGCRGACSAALALDMLGAVGDLRRSGASTTGDVQCLADVEDPAVLPAEVD